MDSNSTSLVPRVAGVTLALAGTGAVLGAGLSAAVLAAIIGGLQFAGGYPWLGRLFAIAAGVGGALGAILAPMSAFTLLRRVALGKALLGTMLGMSLGSAGGLVASGQDPLVAACIR